MKYEPSIEAKRAGVADLAKSGRWVNIQVFSTRMDWGRHKSLAVLQSLIRDGVVEMQDVPSGFKGIGDERQYRLKAGATAEAVTGQPRTKAKGRGDNREEIVHALVLKRGTMTAVEVAEAAKITKPTARSVLERLQAAGRLSKFIGPPPAVGSQRPWCYQAPAGEASA